MATPTYTPLANVTLGSPAASVTFSSIPATYRDLLIVFSGFGSTELRGRTRLNSNSGPIYTYRRMSGTGAAASDATATSQSSAFLSEIISATATRNLQMQINIFDYSATNKHKTILSRAGAVIQYESGSGTELFSNRWANTSAVTSVQILTSTGNWASGTTAALYGIIA